MYAVQRMISYIHTYIRTYVQIYIAPEIVRTNLRLTDSVAHPCEGVGRGAIPQEGQKNIVERK